MNASELRIGNYLQGALSPVVITKIFNKDNVGIGSGDPYNVSSEMPCLTPIPLTEEWLLKFGVNTKSTAWELGFNFNKSYSVVDVDFNHEQIASIQFVHQLQNLYFALTGQELTVPETVNLY